MNPIAVAPQAGIGAQVLFWAIGGLMILSAIFTITRRNPVAAVMSLVLTFCLTACLYATLSAHFLAVLQVMVYAGAIMVLFIFVVMILNRDEVAPFSMRGIVTRGLGVVAGLYLLVKFVVGMVASTEGPGAVTRLVARGGIKFAESKPAAAIPDTFGTVASIGDILFREFVFPFEAISLLLLVAVVGGLVLSRSHKPANDAAGGHQ